MKLLYLIDKAIDMTKSMDYSEITWKFAYRNGRFSSIREFFAQHGEENFSVTLAYEHIAAIEHRYRNGELSYSNATHLKKKTYMLIELYETGELQWKRITKSKIEINPFFENILLEYLDSKEDVYSQNSIVAAKSELLYFLGYLQHEKHYDDFTLLSLRDMHDYVLYTRFRRAGRIDRVISTTRCFVVFLKERYYIGSDLSPALKMPSPKPRRVLPGFTHEEVQRILAQPDQSTTIGKRDYAILMLGKNTGLRKGDIINIHLTDIDWRHDTLLITQGKTGRKLRLPLNTDTENAIINYLQNGRPESHFSSLFLRGIAPHHPLTPQGVGYLFGKYLRTANINHVPGDGKSFHGLRRSIAQWMLDEEVPLTTISQTLGHKRVDSTYPYLSMDEKSLRKCALPLAGLECRKEGLC